MDRVEAYAQTRAQLVSQVSELDAAQLATAVPALPGWSVKDALGHLVGVAADVLGGRMDDAGTPAWTARQVAERSERSVADVCDEWTAMESAFDGWLAGAGPRAMFSVYDAWTHQQDVQGALGLAGVRDDRLDFLVGSAVAVFDQRIREAGAPAVRVHGETVDLVIGGTAAAVELRAGDYEVMRLLFGRRSQRQIDQMYWHGDYAACLPHLHLFDLPEADLID
ncbi:MAG: maleylpyruvate isomerase family mycothiol-dependent enzyme [Acidimicrobiales bacterium]